MSPLPYRKTVPPGSRLILVSDDFMEKWVTRTDDGHKITGEWGEQRPEGWYEPWFTVHFDDRLCDGNPSWVSVMRTQREVAVVYATLIGQMTSVNWSSVNGAIVARWSESGLKRVKRMAWKIRAQRISGGGR